MTSLRRIWLRAHLWLGLGLGLWFVLVGVTGSLLVFYPQIDRALVPAQRVSADCHVPASLEAAYTILRRIEPARTGPWRFELPQHAGLPLVARYYQPGEKMGRHFAPLLVTLDPCSLERTTSRFWGETTMTWLYDLHYQLLLDGTGMKIVGIGGVMLLLSMGSGIVLWWPRNGRWRAALQARLRKGAARLTWDLHTRAGVYGAPVLLVLVATGVMLALPDTVNPVIARFSPLQPSLKPRPPHPVADEARNVTLDGALQAAEAQLPRSRASWIETPDGPEGSYRVRLWVTAEPSRRFPHNYAWIDPGSGAVLATQDIRDRGAGDSLLAWLHPLHNGEALGLLGQWIVALAGLLPLLLAITGTLRWRQKVRARRR
ncbi:MAG: hypothetical protein RLZZ393_689 [Pseudomonadota bacterium]